MSGFFTSSIGKKLLMSLAAIFLLLFLPVHMGINLLLIIFEDPMVYNKAAHFMSSNFIVKIFEVVLMTTLLVHVIWALVLQFQNWRARPSRYVRANHSQTSFFSKYMIHTALLTLGFLALHLMDFYIKAKMGDAMELVHEGVHYHDFAREIIVKFKQLPFVIIYIVAFIFLGFHLAHGLQSALRTLGNDNNRQRDLFHLLSIIYAAIIVGGFTFIPLYVYFTY